ncbi:EAL domain-containing protein [Burkholderia ubonensis]|uniref:EAL domain-containing protein n=1 Tax=Burkholderia ubonensis TaxID=101571 RepID=UPI0009B494F5|nr:EAL domain-containing protein [Burkholderia ubonensis]
MPDGYKRHLRSKGIAYLTNKRGLMVIAEGVEEVAQCNALTEVGIRFAQGFLFQRPANILEFERMYRAARVRMQTPARAVT